MKDFFKNVLATIVGILISGCLFFVLGFMILLGLAGTVMSHSNKDIKLKDNSVLTINLSGSMKDRVEANPFLDYLNLDNVDGIALTDVVSAIKKAKENKQISGIYIYSGYLSASPASLQVIRKALNDFKTSGKFIVAYADDYLQGAYLISSVADKVILNPQGTLDLHGLSINNTFYKGLFDKLGVEMQIFKVGTYKSAVEPYMLDKMSEANKEQVSSFTKDIWASMLSELSASRHIDTTKLNELADSFTALRGTDIVLKNGLVDTLLYETEAKQYVKKLLGISAEKEINQISFKDFKNVPDFSIVKSSKDEIAILYAEGSIVSGNNNYEINDRYLIRQIKKLQEDDHVKAVVFRVNSPGGSAYASEQIWKAITDLKAKKPVVVSMGDYAASGGYYISCNATKIYAEPTTLTGSIGIFGMFPNVEGLSKKVGLSFDGVKTNKLSDFGDVTRPMRDDEKALLQGYIDRGYDLFLTRCAEGRHMSKDSLNLIAQGRVWTGKQALEIGLVDALGGMDAAVADAAKLGGVENSYTLGEYPKPAGPFDALFNIYKNDIESKIAKSYFGNIGFKTLKSVQEIENMKLQDCMQARLPYYLEVK